MRAKNHIRYHIFSPLWISMKGSIDEVKFNSSWFIGNVRNIKFWLDRWNGSSVVDFLGITDWNQTFINDFASSQESCG